MIAFLQRETGHAMSKDQAVSAKLKRKDYEKELRKLQVQVPFAGMGKGKETPVIILFEGRDAAGKGGTIKALTEKVSPRVFRVIALPAPSDREKSQMFMQRYRAIPAGGDRIFDRSWYNRAGVEYVGGLLLADGTQRFLELCPQVEKFAVDGGIILIAMARGRMDEQEPASRRASRIHCGSGSSA